MGPAVGRPRPATTQGDKQQADPRAGNPPGVARGSGVFFGQRVYPLKGHRPQKTPDPVRVATPNRADLNQAHSFHRGILKKR
jgi:hypothetical protein